MADIFPDIPEGYTRNNMDPDLRQILKKAGARIRKLIPEQISMLTKKTSYVEMTTMTNDEENLMLVHLVNYDVTLNGTITPARDLQVQLSLPTGKKVQSVDYSGTRSDLRPLGFKSGQKSGKEVIIFEPDKVDVYGLAVVRFE